MDGKLSFYHIATPATILWNIKVSIGLEQIIPLHCYVVLNKILYVLNFVTSTSLDSHGIEFYTKSKRWKLKQHFIFLLTFSAALQRIINYLPFFYFVENSVNNIPIIVVWEILSSSCLIFWIVLIKTFSNLCRNIISANVQDKP